jgi:hypothetical protein
MGSTILMKLFDYLRTSPIPLEILMSHGKTPIIQLVNCVGLTPMVFAKHFLHERPPLPELQIFCFLTFEG